MSHRIWLFNFNVPFHRFDSNPSTSDSDEDGGSDNKVSEKKKEKKKERKEKKKEKKEPSESVRNCGFRSLNSAK